MDCTIDELEELNLLCENLESQLTLLQEEFDGKCALANKSKEQLVSAKSEEQKLLQDISYLQSNNEENEVLNLREKVKSLQEEIKCTEEGFELELFTKEEELVILTEELSNLPLPHENEIGEDRMEELFKENLDLEIELINLTENLEEQQLSLGLILKENEELQNCIQNISVDLEHIQESLNFKRDEIAKGYEFLHVVQEEYSLLTLELKTLNDKPQEPTDEDSIFSEVNNRRLNLKEIANKMEIDCKNVVKEKLSVRNKLNKLRSYYQKQESLLKSELKEVEYDNECSFIYHKSRKNVLEELVHIYNQIIEEKSKFIEEKLPSDYFQFLNKYVENKTKVIKKLQESRNTRGLSLFMVSSDLKKANLKLKEEMSDTLKNEKKIAELENNIDSFKNETKENIEPEKLPVVLTNAPILTEVQDNKKEQKNANVEKKVAFAAETKSDGNHQVKRGKVLKYKTVFID